MKESKSNVPNQIVVFKGFTYNLSNVYCLQYMRLYADGSHSGWNSLKTYKLRKSAVDALITYSNSNHWWQHRFKFDEKTYFRIILSENCTWGYLDAKKYGIPLQQHMLIKKQNENSKTNTH